MAQIRIAEVGAHTLPANIQPIVKLGEYPKGKKGRRGKKGSGNPPEASSSHSEGRPIAIPTVTPAKTEKYNFPIKAINDRYEILVLQRERSRTGRRPRQGEWSIESVVETRTRFGPSNVPILPINIDHYLADLGEGGLTEGVLNAVCNMTGVGHGERYRGGMRRLGLMSDVRSFPYKVVVSMLDVDMSSTHSIGGREKDACIIVLGSSPWRYRRCCCEGVHCRYWSRRAESQDGRYANPRRFPSESEQTILQIICGLWIGGGYGVDQARCRG